MKPHLSLKSIQDLPVEIAYVCWHDMPAVLGYAVERLFQISLRWHKQTALKSFLHMPLLFRHLCWDQNLVNEGNNMLSLWFELHIQL